ncbi:hypothetical protein [Actinokineospora globicatena]|uniref:hypothetical protein n=1 Tax=Actinokineospora globicatena TaxID=103729 RepID=UPI002553E8A9|nr:hypothetical protein [Actinokineospora globicatena]
MADEYYPFDGSPVYEDAWGSMASLWAPSGLDARTPLVALGSGLSFVIPSGLAGWVRGHRYRNTSAQTKTGDANSNSNPRVDRLVLKLDRTANTVLPVIKAGAPGPSPTPPALTQTDTVWELPVARATCPGSGSAQNYSTLVQEWRPVSSERAIHTWTASASIGATAAPFTAWSAAASNDAMASIDGSGRLLLNVPGIWSIRCDYVSDASVAGPSYVLLSWPGGAVPGSELSDRRGRTPTAPGAGTMAQAIVWQGLVLSPQDDAPITVMAAWGGSATTYTAVLQAHYLGG